MKRPQLRRAPGAGAVGPLLLIAGSLMTLGPGCGPATPLGRAGADLKPPSGWTPVAADRWAVPGTPVAAWSGPGGSSLVAYQLLPIPGGTAEQFSKALENRLVNLTGITILGRKVVDVGGREAARLDVVAPGPGDPFAPTGSGRPYAPEGATLVPTHRTVVAIPRAGDVFVMVWHAPETDAASLAEAVDATLATLRLDAGGPVTRAY